MASSIPPGKLIAVCTWYCGKTKERARNELHPGAASRGSPEIGTWGRGVGRLQRQSSADIRVDESLPGHERQLWRSTASRCARGRRYLSSPPRTASGSLPEPTLSVHGEVRMSIPATSSPRARRVRTIASPRRGRNCRRPMCARLDRVLAPQANFEAAPEATWGGGHDPVRPPARVGVVFRPDC